MSFNPIPNATQDIPHSIRRMLDPIKDVLERSFYQRSSGERVVTRSDLVKLGVITEEQSRELEGN